MSPITPAVRAWLTVAAVLAGVAFGAWVQGLRGDITLQRAKAAQATQRADQSDADLAEFKAAAREMTGAAKDAAAQARAARAKIAAIHVRPYEKPLPVGCRPDLERLRDRNAAIDAFNAAAAGH